jgi:hypothetical protein
MSEARGWDGHAWKKATRAVCLSPIIRDGRQTRLRGLTYELAEAFSRDLAHAVTTFPAHVMRAWRIDQDEILMLIDQRSPISQGSPRWREVEVELASICISAIETNLCDICQEKTFDQDHLQMCVRRICFESIFEFFFFLLRGYSPEKA